MSAIARGIAALAIWLVIAAPALADEVTVDTQRVIEAAEARKALGEWEAAGEVVTAALGAAIAAGAPAPDIVALIEEAHNIYHTLEELLAAQTLEEEALAALAARGDAPLAEAQVMVALANTIYWRGEEARGAEMAAAALDLLDARDVEGPDTRMHALRTMAQHDYYTRERANMLDYLARAEEIAKANPDEIGADTLARHYLWQARTHRVQGEVLRGREEGEAGAQAFFEEAIGYAKLSVAFYREAENMLDLPIALETLSRIEWMAGRREAAVTNLGEAIDIMSEADLDHGRNFTFMAAYMAFYRNGLGEQGAAQRWGERALEVAREEFLHRLTSPAKSGFQDFHFVNFAVTSLFGALMGEAERLDETTPEALGAAFRAAQLTALTPMSEAVALSAKSAAGRDEGLDATVRRVNALRTEWDAADRRLSLIVSGGGTDSDAYRDLLARKSGIEAALAAARAEIARLDPVYAAIWDGEGVSIEALQAVLAPDEAYVKFVLLFEDIYVFAITRERAVLHASDIITGQVCRDATRLRNMLAPGAPLVCTGNWYEASPEMRAEHRFDPVLAHAFYTRLFGPIEDVIAGKPRWTITTIGPLTTAPMAALVTDPPGETQGDFSQIAFLGRTRALGHAASAEALVTARTAFADTSGAQDLAGVIAGAPCIGRYAGPDCDARMRADLETREAIGLASVEDTFRKVDSGAETLDPTDLMELPGAYRELTAIERLLGAGTRRLTGSAFTEAAFAGMDWNGADVLILATHALSAGEFGLREPALVVTPQGEDDGLLTASEIAGLDLPLGLAVLSGCSTAGPEGMPRAHMFSGLALSFLQAGTRSLLVSHYEVEDGFSARFVPDVIARLDQGKDTPPAEALRASIDALLADPALAPYHHPRHWAAYAAFGSAR